MTCVPLIAIMIFAAPIHAVAQTPAQTIFQEQADALRNELHCRPPTQWPDLPRRPRATSIEAAVDSSGVVSYLDAGVVVSTTVQLPQYASFFNPTTEVCEPVIVLEADEIGNFVYTRPLVKTAGVAPVVFFDLLGEHPAKLSYSSAPADSGVDSVSGMDSDSGVDSDGVDSVSGLEPDPPD
jgi:hypothetical protein